MYYEEKIIDGVLQCRTKPDGDWHVCSISKMGTTIFKLQSQVAHLKEKLKMINEVIYSQGAPVGSEEYFAIRNICVTPLSGEEKSHD